jgi:hypothetical protein
MRDVKVDSSTWILAVGMEKATTFLNLNQLTLIS